MSIVAPSIRLPLGLLAAVLSSSLALAAAPGQPPAGPFGIGKPFDSGGLPPGRVKERIDQLSAPARAQALRWLQRFEFTVQDLANLQVDDQGGVYYADTETAARPGAAAAGTVSSGGAGAVSTPAEAFALHSRPGAFNKVFLDFDGEVIDGTAWNGSSGTLVARPFDTDGNPGSWSAAELSAIAEIWHRVAEDLAPFDIDVTTEAPASFDNYTGHVLVTRDVDANGLDMPARGAGGVAYVNVFGSSAYGYYSPALVYFNNLGGGWPPYVAEAAAHEFGHNLGLSHDGLTDGTAYYDGHGSGYVSWAPIMGVGYYRQVTEWSRGEYPGANNSQDDLAIIDAKLRYRVDDHGDDMAGASELLIGADGSVDASNPQDDPLNTRPENKGVIGTRADSDWFGFDTAGGSVSLTVTPAWAAFYRDTRRGADLDVQLRLLASDGSLVASADPLDETAATVDVSLAAGRYYLVVSGVGNSVSPYSDYASLGEYFISGTVPPLAADTTAPSPDPMGWAVAPAADGSNAVTMTALTASDDSGTVQYQFRCVSGGSGCVDSAWQSGTSYRATGLAAHSSYGFTVVARDASGNQTAASVVASATTANSAPLAMDDSAAVITGSSVTLDLLANDSDPDGDPLTVTSLGQPGHGTLVDLGGGRVSYTPAAGFTGSDSFGYTIADGFGGSAGATVSIDVSAAPAVPLAPAGLSATDNADGTATLGWQDNSSNETGFEIQREFLHPKRKVWQGSTTLSAPADSSGYLDAPGSGTYRYRVRAVNAVGASAWTGWVEVTVTDAGSGGNGGGGKGGCNGKKKTC